MKHGKRTRNTSQNKPGLTQEAYEGIRRMLFYNEMVPGQKFSYRELAEKLEMSPTPVIQALKRLEHQGLVQYEPNRGYFTAPMSVREVEEIFDLRELIEISLLPQVIDNINNAALRHLHEIMGAVPPAPGEDYLNRKLLNDRDFHLAVAKISGRRTQFQILEHLFDLLYLKYRGSLLFVASQKSVGSLHQQLIDALESRDLKLTRRIMRKHFRIIRGHALKALNAMMVDRG